MSDSGAEGARKRMETSGRLRTAAHTHARNAVDAPGSKGADSRVPSGIRTDSSAHQDPSAESTRTPAASDVSAAALSLGEIASTDDLNARGGVPALLDRTRSDAQRGLADDESVATSRALYGINRLPHHAPKSFLHHLLEAFEDTTLRILVVAAAVSIGFGAYAYFTREVCEPSAEAPCEASTVLADLAEVIQGAAILVAIVIVSGVNSFQNWSKDREFTSLAALKADRPIQVVRGGEERTISIYDVVVGDVVILAAGDAIPADGVLLRGFDVRVDQSSMTGESDPVKKTPALGSTRQEDEADGEEDAPAASSGEQDASAGKKLRGDVMLISGCQVLEGEGRMLVTAVGRATKMGQMVTMVENQEIENTPLQDQLEAVADKIGNVGMAVGALTFTVLSVLWWRAGMPGGWFSLVKYFIVAVTIVVVAVPEGLPLAVTISLAFSMRRMMKDNNLVRQLQACETMGSATVIASDKTGTLTENRMRVVQAWVFGKHVPAISRLRATVNNPGAIHRLGKAIALNSTAELRRDGPRVEFVRNPSEGALLLMLWEDLGIDYEEERRACLEPLTRRAFKKETRYMTTVVPPESRGEGPIAYVKGAPENVLAMCTFTQSASGSLSPITEEVRFNLREVVEAMAKQGLRTLAVAYRRLPAEFNKRGRNRHDREEAWAEDLSSGAIESELTLLGLFGLQDPLREGVTEAVADVTRAGIRVMMVTGDHRETASHIAQQCGILRPGSGQLVLEGEHFRKLSDDERRNVCENLAVLARSSPTDKHLLVETLKGMGEIVAVTGDGTNDAPALRAADVGLAMGIAGTDVAKEASDIVILDDRFSSIVASVRWGRSIKENIRKFLTFQLTINIVALVLTFVTACTNNGNTDNFPLKPVQLLWVNLIMDSFAALALATEPPSERLMEYAPQGKEEGIITKTMFKNMIGHAIAQAALLLWLHMTHSGSAFFLVPHGSREHQTIVFTTFVALQVFNLFNCRSVRDEWNMFANFGESVVAQVIVAVIVVMQIIIVQFGGVLAQTEPLDLVQWGKCILVGACASLVVGVFLRVVPAFDTEIRQLAPPRLEPPAEPLFADRQSVRAAFHRASSSMEMQPGQGGDGATDTASATSGDVGEAVVAETGSSTGAEAGALLNSLIASGGRSAKARAQRASQSRRALAEESDGGAESPTRPHTDEAAAGDTSVRHRAARRRE